MGYGIWWEVEHHTAVEFSYSSAPEIMLTNIAANTKNLRVGHSAVLSPFRFNHPIRIAERAAFLDHVSNGRFELGLARSTIPEWRTFNIDPDDTRDQMQQAFEMIPKMWTSDDFSWKSDFYEINNISVIPKPYQKPHPKLWQACSSPTSFEQAGRNGVGALGVTLWASLDQVAEWIGLYRDAIKECDPVGEEVNDQVAFFTFVHAAESEQQAMMNGARRRGRLVHQRRLHLLRGEGVLRAHRQGAGGGGGRPRGRWPHRPVPARARRRRRDRGAADRRQGHGG